MKAVFNDSKNGKKYFVVDFAGMPGRQEFERPANESRIGTNGRKKEARISCTDELVDDPFIVRFNNFQKEKVVLRRNTDVAQILGEGHARSDLDGSGGTEDTVEDDVTILLDYRIELGSGVYVCHTQIPWITLSLCRPSAIKGRNSSVKNS